MKKILSVFVFVFSLFVSSLVFAGGYSNYSDRSFKGGQFYLSGTVGYSEMLNIDAALINIGGAAPFGIVEKLDADIIYGGNIGYQFCHQGMIAPRIDIEILHQKNDLDKVVADGVLLEGNVVSGDAKLTTYLLNGYTDFYVTNQFKLIAGLGVGWAHLDSEVNDTTVTIRDKDDVFALQGTVGIGYDVIKPVTLSLNMRYLALTHPKFSNAANRFRSDLETFSVLGSITYRFSAM